MAKAFGQFQGLRDSRVMGALVAAVVGGAVLAQPEEAAACGACYASSSESTVVNDHRMAFAIQKQQTILWDQIVYSGNPAEFAYVIPAKRGTKLEASNEAWFSALETSTRPIIMQPQYSGGGYGGGYGDGTHSGCCSASSLSEAQGGAASSGDAKRETVQIVNQSVVGPYETVTIRSTDPLALETWLKDHGYAIPTNSGPIIASYVQAGLDFIALRLQPGKDVRAMAPIRIVSPGTDTSLPLRMMQIGAGAKVGITLYVIGEGRYRSASFPEAPIDFDKLIWDFNQARSNYQELSQSAMATNDGRSFITEYADRPSFDANAPPPRSGAASNTGLASAYKSACPTYGEPVPPRQDAGAGDAAADDAATGDAAADDAAAPDGGDEDAGGDDGGTTSTRPDAGKPPASIAACDDLDVAVDGMALNDVWVTRLRANLPNAALADTLRLEPAPKQEKFDNVHYSREAGTIPAARVSRIRASHAQGTLALIGLTALAISRLLRRKRSA